MKRFLLIGWSILIIGCAYGQRQTEQLIGDALVRKDSIFVRWYPKSFETASVCFKHGFKISVNGGSEWRLTIKDQGSEMNEGLYSLLLLRSSYDRQLARSMGMWFAMKNPQRKVVVSISVDGYSQWPALSLEIDGRSPTKIESIRLNGSYHDQKAYLEWPAKILSSDYAGYRIEKSVDSMRFHPLTANPYVFVSSQFEQEKTHAFKTDTAVEEGGTYYYRLYGITQFATKGDTSNVVKIHIPRQIHAMVNIDTIVGNEDHLQIQCGLYSEDSIEGDGIRKLDIYRLDSLSGTRKYLGERNELLFSIDREEDVENGYFMVEAIGMEGDTVRSYPYYYFERDETPPHRPEGLTGIIDSLGVVTLSWNEDTTDILRGYKVFRSNAPREEFVEVTREFEDSVFLDTLRLDNLTPDIYYRIVAVDLNFNNSPESETLHLSKPDTIAPVAPVFVSYRMTDDGIRLNWVNSSSVDMVLSSLLRTGGKVTDTLHSWSLNDSVFVDTSGIPGTEYRYILTATDRPGNTVRSQPLILKYGISKAQLPLLRALAERQEKHIKLSWETPDSEVYSVNIFKSKNGSAYFLENSVRDAGLYVDSKVQINNEFGYKIQFVYSNGRRSDLSPATIVIY